MVLVLLTRYVPWAAHMLHPQRAGAGTIASHTMWLRIHFARVIGGGATNAKDYSMDDMLETLFVWLEGRMLQQQRAVAGTIVS